MCEAFDIGQRIVESSELVDQADLARRSAVPDAPLRNSVDLLRRPAPRLCDEADEARLAAFDIGLEHALHFRRQASDDIRLA